MTGRLLVAAAVAIALGSFLVRLVFPYLTFQVAHLNLWQWPQYLALFGLDILAGRTGWLSAVPDRLRRGCGVAAAVGVLGVVGLFVGYAVGVDTEAYGGGWRLVGSYWLAWLLVTGTSVGRIP